MKNGMKYPLAALVLGLSTLLMTGCGGGGGGGGGSATPNSATMTGAVLDGYITGATVCLDVNGNGKCDAGEPTTVTTANGAYSFNYPGATNIANLNVIVNVPAGAIDSDHPNTPIAAPYQMSAPASNSISVTPLTTLVAAAMAANSSLTPETAATQVSTALGLPPTVNLFQNYVAAGNTALQNVAQVVNVVVQNTASSPSSPASSASLNAVLATAKTYTTQAYAASSSSAMSTILDSATVAASNGALITTVPAPSYSQSDALTVYNQLSTIRAKAGGGLLSESTALDQAAVSHAAYLVNNNLAANGTYLHTVQANSVMGGHFELSTNPGYTGANPQNRASAAGYSGTVNEVESFGSSNGQACISSLEDSVYHLTNLLSPYLEMGLNFNAGSNGASVCIIELGLTASYTGQFPPAGSYVTYPYSGQTGVLPTFYNQAEFPTPTPDLATAGHPIFISLYNQTNKTLTTTQVTLHGFTVTTAGGASVPVRVLVASGMASDGPQVTADANLSAPGFIVAVPTSPLLPNTVYNVTVTATVNGTAVNQAWGFTTGFKN